MDDFRKNSENSQNKGVLSRRKNCVDSLKKRIVVVIIAMIMLLQLAACSLQVTCKAAGCSETDIYEDGYCRYHYYMRAGENFLKDIFN